MKHLLAENLAVLICAAAGFACGAVRYLRPKKPLYASMIVLGLGCIALGRLYQCVRLLTGSSITDRFQLGTLGIVGAFSFFFSANYGQIDSLVDDGSREFAPYRRRAWAGPAVIAALYAAVAAGGLSIPGKLVCGGVSAVIGCSCYYHVKHLLIPDVYYGVVRCLRLYNALALVFGILCMLEMVALTRGAEGLLAAVSVLLCAVSAAIIPVMDRGVRAWKT